MKKLQKGRSMIEMLGVLAIIGVLSVGGLAGYTMAMNRHRANQALDYAQRAFVVVQTWGNGTDKVTVTTGTSNKGNCETVLSEEAVPSGVSECSVGRTGSSDNPASATCVKLTVANASIGKSIAERVIKDQIIGGDAATTYYYTDIGANAGWSTTACTIPAN